jgi:hypothetical protein
MKSFTRVFALLAGLFLLLSASSVWACNLSDLTPITVIRHPGGPDTAIVRLCTGMGITGSTKGGDQSTRSVSFGFFSDSLSFNILSFSPTSMVGPMGCSMPGQNDGPQGNPINSQGSILFIDPGYYGDSLCSRSPYGCVNSTLFCGNVQSYCMNFTFVFDHLPDSMRAFGVEGGGKVIGGCFPNSDMLIDFTVLPVIWGELSAQLQGRSTNISWSTLIEVNSDFFLLERAGEDGVFATIGTVMAAGNSQSLREYLFVDDSPLLGHNFYRITQIDREGRAEISKTVDLNYFEPSGLTWGAVSPNPSNGLVVASIYCPTNATVTLQLTDLHGRIVGQYETDAIAGGRSIRIDLAKLAPGIYYLVARDGTQKIVHKVVRN